VDNRRKDVRVPIRAQVSCVADFRSLRGVTRNISQKGIQIEAPGLSNKANVHLTFRLPFSDAIIDATGTVVWGVGRRNGIRFDHVGEQSQQSIRDFVEERKAGAS
jgi:c-di-GMP-binding flagellar brake protein YcgR